MMAAEISYEAESAGAWLNADVPAELAQTIGETFAAEHREALARTAADAAVAEVSPAYVNPFVTNAALAAARIALGLKESTRQGEQ